MVIIKQNMSQVHCITQLERWEQLEQQYDNILLISFYYYHK